MIYKHWMVRNDDNGISYNRFKWNAIGKWTIANDWKNNDNCGNGLHGQGISGDIEGFGYSQDGTRFVFCEIDPLAGVVCLGDKIKCKRARIVAEGIEALLLLLQNCKNNYFKGSLRLSSLQTLPSGISLEAGWSIDLRSLQTLSTGVSLKAGSCLNLSSLQILPKGINIKAEKIILKPK